MIVRRLGFLLIALIATGAAAPPTDPSGRYEIVAIRAASDTTASLAERQDPAVAALLGRSMTFGPRISWFDDRFCPHSSRAIPSAEPWVGQGDPNLSDLQIAPGPGDRRMNHSLIVDCGGRAHASIVPFLMVDRRVMVTRTRNGAAFLVLEQPLRRSEARAVEAGLVRAGFDPGPVDGRIDARTRRAAALFAQGHGAEYAFEQGVLTENLVTALTGQTAAVHAPTG